MAAPKPRVLLIGQIFYAQAEWDALKAIAEITQVRSTTRKEFLSDCTSGVYNDVYAISRTYDSVAITGRIDQALIDVLPNSVRYICHNGAGYDQIDVNACTARGIAVSNTCGVVDAGTANTAIYLLLGALRRSHIPSTAIRAGKWRGNMGLGHDPGGKVLGILGMGGIGRALALRAVPFGFQIQYHNRRPVCGELNPTNAKYVSFEELLRTSDVISIHLPLSDLTRHLIGQKEFAMMKDGVVVVNTARGSIIDENALVEALDSGKIFGAGLDVFEKEPEIHPGLIGHDNVVLLPHAACLTFEIQRAMEVLVIDNLRSAIENGNLLTPVAEQQKSKL